MFIYNYITTAIVILRTYVKRGNAVFNETLEKKKVSAGKENVGRFVHAFLRAPIRAQPLSTGNRRR